MKPTFDPHSLLERLATKSQDRLRALTVALSLLIVCALVILANQLDSLFAAGSPGSYEVGKIADRDLFSNFTFSYVDAQATRDAEDDAAARIPPVFQVRADVAERSLQEFNRFADMLSGFAASRVSDKEAFKQVEARFPGVFRSDEISSLLKNLDLVTILPIASHALEDAMSRGILALSNNEFDTMPDSITLVRTEADKPVFEQVRLEAAVTLKSLPTHLRAILSNRDLSDRDIQAVVLLVSAFAKENAFYDFAATQHARERGRSLVAPLSREIVKGMQIIKKGSVISPEAFAEVQALESYARVVNIRNIVGTILFVFTIYLLALTLLSPAVISRRIEGKYVYLLTGLYLFYIAVMASLSRSALLPEWLPFTVILPTALVAMIVSILVDTRVGVIFTLILSLSLVLLGRLSPYSFLFAFLSGVVATFVVSGAEKRLDLIRASVEVAAANALILLVFGFLQNYELSWFLIALVCGALNGFLCGILNLGLLPIFEHLLNAPTPFRLMELSDMNSPLLKRMLTLAPGTYGHSVSVANMAESACRAIGANALLARVGAYYHDIGKIDQSEYFIENQTSGNVHDELKPSLSAAVIRSHVKIGIERAKELGLPQEVIDIIAQHHGSSLISYFYDRALKSGSDSKVNPEDFSYSGSPPASREAAVVMLADTLEASSRTLKKPTVAKLEKFIWAGIMEKFTSGQMNDSDLTFRDLETIKKTFVQILAGSFHSRIEYPDRGENAK